MDVYLRDARGVLFPVMLGVKAEAIPDLVQKAEEWDRNMSKRFGCNETPISQPD